MAASGADAQGQGFAASGATGLSGGSNDIDDRAFANGNDVNISAASLPSPIVARQVCPFFGKPHRRHAYCLRDLPMPDMRTSTPSCAACRGRCCQTVLHGEPHSYR